MSYVYKRSLISAIEMKALFLVFVLSNFGDTVIQQA